MKWTNKGHEFDEFINNDCSITKNKLNSLENTEFSCQK